MDISNLVVRAVNTFPRTAAGWAAHNKRKIRRADVISANENLVTVGKLLSSIGPVPEKSILLGRCADGLPFFISLGDPELGSILISGDEGCGKTHQLQVMVDAAMRLNQPYDLQISIISHNPQDWALIQNDPRNRRFCQGVYAWYDPRLDAHIQHLAALAEARRAGETGGPALLVILDDLNFVEALNCDSQVNLRWLLQYGAQSNIWIAAAIKAVLAAQFPFWIEVFCTRIFGRVISEKGAFGLGEAPGLRAHNLEPGFFRTWTGAGWMTHQLPLLGDALKRRI